MAYEVVSGLGEYELAGMGAILNSVDSSCDNVAKLQSYLAVVGYAPSTPLGKDQVWTRFAMWCLHNGVIPFGSAGGKPYVSGSACKKLHAQAMTKSALMAKKAMRGVGEYELAGLGSYEVISGLGEITSAQVGTKMATGSWCGSPNPKVIQQALDELGFPTKADGIWGSGSLASLNAFGATRGLPKATFPTSAHCTALKQALAEKEAAAIAAAQAATEQPSTQQIPVTNVAPGAPPAVISPSPVDAGDGGGMSTRTMVLLGVAGVAAVGILVAVALSGSEKHEETAELKKNHDCDGFSCLECYPELCESSAMIPRVADQALAMALADPAGAKAFLRNAGDKLLGIDGEPDPIIPRWTWAAAAGLGGLALGIFLSQRFPRYMPRLAPLRKNR